MTIDKQKLKASAERAIAMNPPGGNGNPYPAIGVLATDALALLAEIEQLEKCLFMESAELAWSDSDGRAIQAERDQLKAENEALRSLVLSALEEGKGRPGAGGNAPGHCHAVPGVWDRGNGERSGTACGWCRIWNAAQAMAKEASHG